MQTINFVLDILLVLAGFRMAQKGRLLGGIIGSSFRFVSWGAIVLGTVHVLETMMFALLNLNEFVIEFTHRVLVAIGFILILAGFQKLETIKKT